MVWYLIALLLTVLIYCAWRKAAKNRSAEYRDEDKYKNIFQYVVHRESGWNCVAGLGAVVMIIVWLFAFGILTYERYNNDILYQQCAELYPTYVTLLQDSNDIVNQALYEEVLAYNKQVTLKSGQQDGWYHFIFFSPKYDWHDLSLVGGVPETVKVE